MNTWIGIGNLTADPELRYTPSGTAVCSFSIAINNGKDKDGQERPPTYIDVQAWDKQAENCAEYLRKGNKAAVNGAITIDKWEDNEGNKRVKYRIRAFTVEFLTPRPQGERQPEERAPARDTFDADDPIPF